MVTVERVVVIVVNHISLLRLTIYKAFTTELQTLIAGFGRLQMFTLLNKTHLLVVADKFTSNSN